MIDLDLWLLGPAHIPWVADIQKLVAQLETRKQIRVQVASLNWETAWGEMVRSSIQGRPPAVSEIGTTWVADLVGMNVLHPLPASLVQELGGEKAYLSESWKSCYRVNEPEMWAVPWISGARVLYYRQDILYKARINPETAFADPQAMQATLAQLQEAGVRIPWVTPTTTSINTVHQISTWVWAAGGDFISPKTCKFLFADDPAVEGMADYFALGRYMGPDPQGRTFEAATDLFWQGGAAVTMDGTWVYRGQRTTADPEVLDNLGVALLPGPAFVGGSNLVIWANTPEKNAALDLLQFLSGPEAVMTMFRATGLIPARRDLLHSDEVTGRPFGPVFNQAAELGHSWPNCPFTSMIEDKLHHIFGQVWTEVLASPEKDPREIVRALLKPLKSRLEASVRT